MNPDITGNYEFTVTKEDGWLIAYGNVPGGQGHLITQGRNEEELFYMLGDCLTCAMGVKVGWWNRFLSRVWLF